MFTRYANAMTRSSAVPVIKKTWHCRWRTYVAIQTRKVYNVFRSWVPLSVGSNPLRNGNKYNGKRTNQHQQKWYSLWSSSLKKYLRQTHASDTANAEWSTTTTSSQRTIDLNRIVRWHGGSTTLIQCAATIIYCCAFDSSSFQFLISLSIKRCERRIHITVTATSLAWLTSHWVIRCRQPGAGRMCECACAKLRY